MALDKIFDALSAESNERAQKALAVELEIYNKAASRQVYTSLLVSTVKTLRLSVEQGGNIAPSSAEDTIPTSALQQLVHSPDVLEKNGYIFQEKNDQSDSPQEPTKVPCDRCLKPFDPKHYYSASGQEEDCRYHLRGKIRQGSSRLYSCCHRPIGELPCQVADKHVYRNLSAPSDFSRIDEWKELPSQRRVVALDAEMIYTTAGTEIARISIVSWDETATLDILVHPEAPVVDYNTRYSGITAQSFSNVENDGISTFHNLRNAVLPKIIGPKTILIGHSLENDLASLKVHPSVFHSSIDNCFKLH
jgi:RNA exonuclease 1